MWLLMMIITAVYTQLLVTFSGTWMEALGKHVSSGTADMQPIFPWCLCTWWWREKFRKLGNLEQFKFESMWRGRMVAILNLIYDGYLALLLVVTANIQSVSKNRELCLAMTLWVDDNRKFKGILLIVGVDSVRTLKSHRLLLLITIGGLL